MSILITTFLKDGSKQEPGMLACMINHKARQFKQIPVLLLSWPVKHAAWQNVSLPPPPDCPLFTSEPQWKRRTEITHFQAWLWEAKLETGDILLGIYFRTTLNGVRGSIFTMKQILPLFYLIPPPTYSL